MSESAYRKAIVLTIVGLVGYYMGNPRRHLVTSKHAACYASFVFAQIISTLAIARQRPTRALFTLLVTNVLAHAQHYASHTEVYLRCFDAVGLAHSHDTVHHSDDNRTPKAITTEVVGNVVGVALLWNPLMYLYLDPWVALHVGFIYASYHNLNQWLLRSRQHELHHKRPLYNLGPDYVDVLVHTKLDRKPECLNTGLLNIVASALIVVVLRRVAERVFCPSSTTPRASRVRVSQW